VLAVSGSSAALAAELHVFDPVLSLTGNCETEAVDPIPDPPISDCPSGDHPPKGRFKTPAGIATDSYGDIYVASAGSESSGAAGRIDVFDAEGNFITELADPNGPGPLAVDSKGNLYVSNRFTASNENVVRYSPTVYKPTEGEIAYGTAPVVIVPNGASSVMGLALEASTDRLWVKFGNKVELFASKAAGENAPIESFGSFGGEGLGIAVDDVDNILYASSQSFTEGTTVTAFELAAPHDAMFTIKGSAVPDGKFISGLSLAVDEGTGHLLALDGGAKKVYEFDTDGSYLATIDVNVGKAFENVFSSAIGVDNGENSPNGAENPFGRYLYVPSGLLKTHTFAFGPSNEGKPEIKSISFANVGETEAELHASVEPFGLVTHYTFEYLTQQQFEEQGKTFAGAEIAGEGDIPAGNSPVEVLAAATDLQPGTTYRFRVVATNNEGSDEAEGLFATYLAAASFSPCTNDVLRIGLSALLPDCRAYELVTPPSTNARSPHGVNGFLGSAFFATRETSPLGDKVSFEIEGGTIPGSEATGSLAGDPYLATRGEAGWSTADAGATGFEAPVFRPGSNSPDQGYSFWSQGTATNFVRYPDGHSAFVGRGSLSEDQSAAGKLISEGGGHIVFESDVPLEPASPGAGVGAVYDRTADEVTHVVSLLPDNTTPNEKATYSGASLDGRGIAFVVGSKLYLRYENAETFEIGDGVTFAGIAEGGARIFYLEGGDLYRFDANTGVSEPFTTSGDITPVNVSSDGSTAYFVSPSVLTGSEELNPNEAEPVENEENLYRSKEGTISFVGTVTDRDVVGEVVNEQTGGLGLWTEVVRPGKFGNDPSRTTADGGVLLFESRAALDGYDPEGHPEVYRYDSVHDELACLSCNPTLASASGGASLQSVSQQLGGLEALSPFSHLGNLSPDGRRAFFQSTEALVPGDGDGLQDVYEWEAQGMGSCQRATGCLYLISSGNSARIDYLYAVSESGDDVFFRSADLLLPADLEETPSIYDARVDGGFPEPVAAECEGEGCRPNMTTPPSLGLPAAPALGAEDNVRPPKRCRKGTHKVKRHGKVRCVKKKHHHRKAGTKKNGGGK